VRLRSTVCAQLARLCVALTRAAGENDDWQGRDGGQMLQMHCGEAPGRVRYLTKSTFLTTGEAWEALAGNSSLFTRCGVVSRVHADVVRREVKRMRATELAVIGDLDPLDLTVLLSLACGGVGKGLATRSIPVLWRGVRDDWRAECDRARRRTGYRSEPTIQMTEFEQRHWERLEGLDVPWEQIIGPHSAALLRSGRKLELEGASKPAIYGDGFPRRVLRLAGQ